MKSKRLRKRKIFLFLTVLLIFGLSLQQLLHKNQGDSISQGSHGKGSIENAYLLPYVGKNYSYFSPLSYFILDDGYVHSSVYQAIKDAYLECETTCPGKKFKMMESGRKRGGKMLIHYTHQNGMSVDFMVPKKRKQKQFRPIDHIGAWHYLLKFDSEGKSSIHESVEIDFETMAKHIIALDNASKKNGLRIKKVILKIDLKNDFYASPSGKEVKRRGIYFAQSLPSHVDNVHDEHYHIDFELND